MMKAMSRVLGSLWLAGLIMACASVWTLASAKDDPARAVVEKLDAQLLETMKQADDLGFAGRYRKLAPVIAETFDLDRIARMVLGSQWKALDSGQQKQYLQMFRQDTVATYASRFDGFDGESFKIKEVKDAPGNRRQVNTVIVDREGKETPIQYVLDDKGGQWRIINVVAKGVSDLALKRGQYTSTIDKQGADQFIQQFEKQLDKYPHIPDVEVKSDS